MWVGALVFALSVLGCWLVPAPVRHFRSISPDPFYSQAMLRMMVLTAGGFVGGYLAAPRLAASLERLRPLSRLSTYTGLAAICALQWLFIIRFGRRQFGAWDENIVIDTGWRQLLGQRPYTDFPATTPEGFHIGIKWAFQIFGPSWDSCLYATAIFTVATFLWMYWLARRLGAGSVAAAAIALAVECAGGLTLCFWWYNEITLTMAAVFLIASVAYARIADSRAIDLSYFAALSILCLMKPNIAGPLILGCFGLLVLFAPRRIRTIVLTLAAAAAAIMVLLLNNVSIPAMLQSFLGVAKGRGGLHSQFGLWGFGRFDKYSALLWLAILSLPLLILLPRALRQLRLGQWKELGISAMYPLGLLVSFYGLVTNGEWRDVECTLILAAGGLLCFAAPKPGPFWQRLGAGILCASIVADLFYGASRIRIYSIGPGLFFTWKDNNRPIDDGFLRGMRVSESMIEVQNEVSRVIGEGQGPYFFGPRLEMDYAVHHVPSPWGFPTYWQPGTAFGMKESEQILRSWDQQDFRTLIFLKKTFGGEGAMTFYTKEQLDRLDQRYVADDSYPHLRVYRRKDSSTGVDQQPGRISAVSPLHTRPGQ